MKRLILALTLLASLPISAEPLWQGKGRIALSSDGNEHDHDDWAATPLTLALLAARGLQDKVVLYTYADHIWGSNLDKPNSRGKSAYEHIQESALGAKEWFGYDKSEFICAVDDPERAYNAMAKVIDASTKKNPLIIIAAGPMQVVGEALNRSKKEARQYVTVISHSKWNNIHSDTPSPREKQHGKDVGHTGWTFAEMEESFGTESGGGARFVQIIDQNGGDGYEGLAAPKADFDWIKSSSARSHSAYKEGSWDWLYSRIQLGLAQKGVLYDASDAGMAIFMLTGEERTNAEMAREIMENPTK
ncbi:MAG: hypothetical protein SNH88_04430 [Rikenellaceae bacterium]